jgi:predicted nucleic acid-binding protein
MNGVLLDSSGLIALWNRRDQWNEGAVRAFESIPEATELVTTTYILAECGNTFARSEIRRLLADLGDRLHAQGRLIAPTDVDWQVGWSSFCNGFPGSASLVDQLSFAVMRRLSIERAFTNDGHFRDAGFEVLF